MGIHLLVSIWPTVDPRSENYFEMREQNMLIRAERGPGALVYCRGAETYYDSTNPSAREFVWKKVKEHYYESREFKTSGWMKQNRKSDHTIMTIYVTGLGTEWK
ncbi:MAG: TIM-barrel domain-containing protein [Sellimonas intestinalis]